MKYSSLVSRVTAVAMIATLGIGLSNCAALFRSSHDTVNFSSEPSGAHVLVDGMEVGKTPAEISLESKKTHTVEFKLDGYETRSKVLTSSVGAGWIVLDVLGGVIPVVVDAATGSWNGLDETNVHVMLDKK